VLTKHAPKVDFGGFQSFHLRPEIRTLNDEGELAPMDQDVADVLLDATADNLTARGFTAVAPTEAELAVEMLYLDFITTSVWCYSWWDYYYWGYPGWGYYPYYGSCDGTAWRSGLLVTVAVDLTAAREDPIGGGGGAGGEGGGGDSSLRQFPGIWFSGVYGVELTSREAVDGINQAFSQSPYLAADR